MFWALNFLTFDDFTREFLPRRVVWNLNRKQRLDLQSNMLFKNISNTSPQCDQNIQHQNKNLTISSYP